MEKTSIIGLCATRLSDNSGELMTDEAHKIEYIGQQNITKKD